MKRRSDQILMAFLRFHMDNPHVWKLFEKFTLQAIGAGAKHYGSRAILERIRWHVNVEVKGAIEVKLNDHYTPYYARMFIGTHPEHADIFKLRVRISELKPPHYPDRQVFIAPEPDDEDELMSILRAAAG